jgi:hypothetical protein
MTKLILNVQELAEKLNGCEYGNEVSKKLEAQARRNGLVIVFGASDDLVEFRGAIFDEQPAFDREKMFVDCDGVVGCPHCDADDCIYVIKRMASARAITTLWRADGNICWTYQTNIPHATFNVIEKDRVYCRGIVFSIDDVGEIRKPQFDVDKYAKIESLKSEIEGMKAENTNRLNCGNSIAFGYDDFAHISKQIEELAK